ncbi:MAG: DNRLRE domain-containing protein [Candidatus Heimdallarchaeota archaeon]|nr:MAG: DNRLRE domain-containing protein [Candidatus Heimdallarchaeota archaeon]
MSEIKMNNHQRIIILIFFFSLIIGLSVSSNASITTVITISVEADSYVDSDDPTSNFGEEDYIKVSKFEGINNTNTTKTGLIRFSLTELQDIDIDSVFLELYVLMLTVRHRIGVYKSSDVSWNELTVTHNTRPSYNETVLDTELVGPDWEWYSWSVTEAVNDSVETGQITFVIKVEKIYKSTDWVWFFSKDSELKEGYSPRLYVNYTESKASSGPNYLIILISLFPLLLKKQQRNKGE